MILKKQVYKNSRIIAKIGQKKNEVIKTTEL